MTSREYPDRPIVGVGAIILHGKGEGARVLLARRGRAPSLGEWSIPGGLVKLGETLEQAVVREVEEETGLKVEVAKLVELLDRIIYERDEIGDTPQQQATADPESDKIKYHYVIADYLCGMKSGQQPTSATPSSDATELYWCLRNELPRFNLRPMLLKILQECLREDS